MSVILLGGAHGVGKSTVLAALRQTLPGGACIELDVLWSMLGGPVCVGADYVTALDLGAAVVRALLAAGRSPIVVASPWSPEGAAAFRERLGPGGGRARQVSLVATVAELDRRVASRPPWAFHQMAEIATLNATLRERGGDVIDTTHLTPAEVLAHVVAYFGEAPGGGPAPTSP